MIEKLVNRVIASCELALQWIFKPSKPVFKKKIKLQLKHIPSTKLKWGEIPNKSLLLKKFVDFKMKSVYGQIWDAIVVFLSIVACVQYVVQSYFSTYSSIFIYSLFEAITTQFFLIDFVFNYLSSVGLREFISSSSAWIDIVTVVPYFIYLATAPDGVNISIFRFVRILRLFRILKLLKPLRSMSGIHRQILTISLTLTSLLFVGAGLVQIVENDLQEEIDFKCKFIGALTNWQPSCDESLPFVDIAGSCDCDMHDCQAVYLSQDPFGKPSLVSCITITFFQAFYVMVITGDIFICCVEICYFIFTSQLLWSATPAICPVTTSHMPSS